MAHLWIEELPGEWAIVPLKPPRVDLASLCAGSLRTRPGRDAARAAGAILQQAESSTRHEWLLIARPDSGISINGLPLAWGLRVMEDRDEIRLPNGETLFYSAEDLARVEPLPALDRSIVCPRCRQPVLPGTQAVRCPQCGVWYHQQDELPCFTYAPTCAHCDQPTALDAGYRWTPAEL